MQPVKTDRRHTLRTQIKTVLEAHKDGLSPREIASRITYRTNSNSVRQSLLSLPGAYIDRWCKQGHGPYHAVWCLSEQPMPDCPKPER